MAPPSPHRDTEQVFTRRLRRLVVAPAVAPAGLFSSAWVVHETLNTSLGWTAAGATLGCCIVASLSARAVTALCRDVRESHALAVADQTEQQAQSKDAVLRWIEHFRSLVADGQAGLARALAQVDRGEPVWQVNPSPHDQPGDPFADVAIALQEVQAQAVAAVAALAARLPREVEQAEVLVSVARRLHALVSRTVTALSALEKGVEDPDLLHALFTIDHLVTQTRRATESLAVLGGQTPRRVRRPIPLTTVLRQGVAEIEQYARVRVVPPDLLLAVPGYAGPEVIHLLAELLDNATKFSPPSTAVTMRAEGVPAGLAIEIEDRGLHMSPEKVAHLNHLLAAPDRTNVQTQVRDGHIGLLVAARLAHRHGIHVSLRPNILGGTQALVVVPNTLLMAADQPVPSARTAKAQTAPVALVPAAIPSAIPSHHAVARRPAEAPPLPQRSGRVEVPRDASQGGFDSRPVLPRRSQVPGRPDLGAHPSPTTMPSGRASAGLMARYSAGVRQGTGSTEP
ncbi:ATP-binding protein [Streptacidiphilus griseoplanus]|uniref:ATP-binding protein n=1 Tax=Peterkaempfera griseoplana TaxID=66896 RepID=UPI0006E144BA|nr:ATP-binding protein [Peterkaempfera griseoplana]